MEPGVRTPVMPGGPLPSPNKLPSRASPCQPSMGRTIYRRVSRAATEGGPACLPACPRYSERCPKGALGTSRGAAAGSVAERSGGFHRSRDDALPRRLFLLLAEEPGESREPRELGGEGLIDLATPRHQGLPD